MRALAEYIMRGRSQAIIVAVLGIGTLFFAWLSGAAVALVTLRKGFSHSSLIVMWALLPAAVIAVMGQDVGPLTMLLGVTVAAVVLRQTVSMAYALVAASISGLLTAAAMAIVGDSQIEALLKVLETFFEQLRSEALEGSALKSAVPTALDVAGLIGFSNTISVTAALLIGRWWQAMLYNEGGFKQEFHNLRLTPGLCILLLGSAALIWSAGAEYRFWGILPLLPVLVASFALVHCLVAIRGLGTGTLVAAYLGALLIDPIKIVLILAVVTDSFIDIRTRLKSAD